MARRRRHARDHRLVRGRRISYRLRRSNWADRAGMKMSIQPYEARSFRFIELLSIGPSRTGIIWRMKLYGIAYRRELPRPELLDAARRVAAETLAKETASNYKVGFVGAHDGRNA